MKWEHPGYVQTKGNEDLIGLKAKILPEGSTYMHGEVGTIKDSRGTLCLDLDTPIKSSRGWDISGIYLIIGGYATCNVDN